MAKTKDQLITSATTRNPVLMNTMTDDQRSELADEVLAVVSDSWPDAVIDEARINLMLHYQALRHDPTGVDGAIVGKGDVIGLKVGDVEEDFSPRSQMARTPLEQEYYRTQYGAIYLGFLKRSFVHPVTTA